MTLPKQDIDTKSDSRSPVRTLLLEPDEPLREALLSRLTPISGIAEICKEGKELIEQMMKRPADLVIADWGSLGKSASFHLREIQRINPGAAVILTGEEPPVREAVRALKEGVFDFLTKPYSFRMLEETIGQALENRRSFMEILQLSEKLKKANRTLKVQKRKLLQEKQSLKKWTEEMNLLNEMTREVVATLDLQTILHSAVRHIGALVSYDLIALSLREERTRYLASEFPLEPPFLAAIQNDFFSGEEASYRTEVLSAQKGIPAGSSYDVVRNLSCEINVGEREIGAIHLWRLSPLPGGEDFGGLEGGQGDFGKHEAQILSMAAGTLALALNNAMAHRQVQSLATTDGLTGLLNKRTFESTLGNKFKTTARYQNPLSLILIDLDHFKEINDDHGHQAGDTVLREMAKILTQSLRDIDIPARYGGDELAVILPETSPEQAFFVAKRIKKLVESYPCRMGNEVGKITVSIGIASCPSPVIRKVEDLVEAADRALYAAKRGGRNRVESSADLFNHENVYLEAPAL